LRVVGAYITYHFFYPDNDGGGKKDFVLEEASQISEDCIENELYDEFDGQTLHSLGVYTAIEAPTIRYTGRKRWFDEPKFATAAKLTYLVYGNEPQLWTQYASICMIASAPGHDIKAKWSEGEKD
jgi:hypothetical protein